MAPLACNATGCPCVCHAAGHSRVSDVARSNTLAKSSKVVRSRDADELNRVTAQALVNLSQRLSSRDESLLALLLQEIDRQRDMPIDGAGFFRLAVLAGDKWTAQSLGGRTAELVNSTRTPNSPTALALAAELGDMNMVHTLMGLGATLEQPVGPSQRTPLMLASQSDPEGKMVACLLGLGADPHMGDKDGKCSLLLAAEAGNVSVIKLLLKKGADILAVDNQGAHALTLAAKNGEAAACEALLAHDPEIMDVVDGLDLRPLDYAVGEGKQRSCLKLVLVPLGHVEAVRMLLRAGAPIECNGRNVAQVAWNPEVKRVLKDAIALQSPDQDGVDGKSTLSVKDSLRKKKKKKAESEKQGSSVQQGEVSDTRAPVLVDASAQTEVLIVEVSSSIACQTKQELSQPHESKCQEAGIADASCQTDAASRQFEDCRAKQLQLLLHSGKYNLCELDCKTGLIVSASRPGPGMVEGASIYERMVEGDQWRIKMLLTADSWRGAAETLVPTSGMQRKYVMSESMTLLPEMLQPSIAKPTLVTDTKSTSPILQMQYRRLASDGTYKFINARAVRAEGSLYILEEDSTWEQYLRETVQQLSATVQAASVGGFLYDVKGRIHMVSDISASALGVPADQLVGQHVYDTVAPEDRVYLSSLVGSTVKDTRTFCRIKADGSEMWVEAQIRECVSLLSDQVLYLSVEKDCTELRALASGAEINKLISGIAGDILIAFNHDGTVASVNSAVERVLGYKPSELIGKNGYDMIIEEDAEATKRRCAEIVAQGPEKLSTTTIEYRKKKKNGGWCWVEGRAQIMEYDTTKGRISHVVVERDITERKAMEEERSRAKLFEDVSPDVLLQTDSKGMITRVSAACNDVLGIKPDELVGHSYVDSVHPEDRPKLAFLLEQIRTHMTGPVLDALLLGRTVNYDRMTGFYRFRRMCKNGNIVRIETKYRIAADTLSGGYAIYYIERDVSARYKVLKQLRTTTECESTGDAKSITGALRAAFAEALNRAAPSLQSVDGPVSDVTASDWSDDDSMFGDPVREAPASSKVEAVAEPPKAEAKPKTPQTPPMQPRQVSPPVNSPPVVQSPHSDRSEGGDMSPVTGATNPANANVALDDAEELPLVQGPVSRQESRQERQRWVRPQQTNSRRTRVNTKGSRQQQMQPIMQVPFIMGAPPHDGSQQGPPMGAPYYTNMQYVAGPMPGGGAMQYPHNFNGNCRQGMMAAAPMWEFQMSQAFPSESNNGMFTSYLPD
eukprot:jgi/Chlat1/3090/Chrsp21S03327